ncbi:RteC domain-containing protein [Bacteroides sp. BFG-638]|uniref:RteC domain-containing protein n=1 Tax=Bacteroides vicugnae TaxID=3037989 RepID=A0ABU5HR73_9BACE|nr:MULTISPECIES: RteC domain-containing protein [unclassified Bacteroides]MCS2947095.1 RteC domain-containing protein [Bacteroides sp. BFG-638]MCS3310725.1 RteC domain-containing protein [Bacteroides sp. BFG-637]MDY7255998.1 RteC domain-containing protein [Bacteroides sp. A1-P5]MDY7258490.1 RteC domain-containing protein [Bacteroides sp. A2-P53]
MRNFAEEMLLKIDAEIESIGFNNDITINDALHMVKYIIPLYDQLRKLTVEHIFSSTEEEIYFFKELKPSILGRYLYFNKVYRIESQCPSGSNDVIKEYLNDELGGLTYFFRRNLELYQYYRSKATTYDTYYFIRGKADIRLCCDSFQCDRDPMFSTGYDHKIAKILANEMLQIYLNKRIINLGQSEAINKQAITQIPYPANWTSNKIFLIELGYALYVAGDINNGNITVKEIMDLLGTMFNIDLGDYYRGYITLKNRKKDRTLYLKTLIEKLLKRMEEDDEK